MPIRSRERVLVGLLFAFLASAGCDDKAAPPAAPQPVASEPSGGLSIFGEHEKVASALAIGTEGENSWRVVVSTKPLDCAALSGAYPERPAKAAGVQLDFWLTRPLGPNGEDGRWAFRSAFLRDGWGGRPLTTLGAHLGDLSLVGDSELQIKGLELSCQDRKKLLSYSGDLVAKRCARVTRSETPRPQSKLTLSVAGRRFAIHGASLRPRDGEFSLRLTRAAHDCETVFTEGYDFYVDLALAGSPPTLQFAALQGDIFPDDPSGRKGREGFKVAFGGPLEGVGPLPVTLEGTLDLRGYKLALGGQLVAQRCVKP